MSNFDSIYEASVDRRLATLRSAMIAAQPTTAYSQRQVIAGMECVIAAAPNIADAMDSLLELLVENVDGFYGNGDLTIAELADTQNVVRGGFEDTVIPVFNSLAVRLGLDLAAVDPNRSARLGAAQMGVTVGRRM